MNNHIVSNDATAKTDIFVERRGVINLESEVFLFLAYMLIFVWPTQLSSNWQKKAARVN